MKKILALLLAMMMVLALAACGGNEETPSGSGTTDPGASQQEQPGNGEIEGLAEMAEQINLPGLTAPANSSIYEDWTNLDNNKICFVKNGEYTESEHDDFIKQVWDLTKQLSSDGNYDATEVEAAVYSIDETYSDLADHPDYQSEKEGELVKNYRIKWYFTYNDRVIEVVVNSGFADRIEISTADRGTLKR